jgi:DNA polymerase-1
MIMQVHDELVFEVPEEELEVMTQGLPARMSEAAQLAVPLKVDTGIGDNWDEAH